MSDGSDDNDYGDDDNGDGDECDHDDKKRRAEGFNTITKP